MVTVDFGNPTAEIESATERSHSVMLGTNHGDVFIQNDSASRLLFSQEFRLSGNDSIFKLKDVKGRMSWGGTFYFDACG